MKDNSSLRVMLVLHRVHASSSPPVLPARTTGLVSVPISQMGTPRPRISDTLVQVLSATEGPSQTLRSDHLTLNPELSEMPCTLGSPPPRAVMKNKQNPVEQPGRVS